MPETPDNPAPSSSTDISRRTVLRRAAYVTPAVFALGVVPRGSVFAGSGLGPPPGGTTTKTPPKTSPKTSPKVTLKKSSVPITKLKPKTGVVKSAKTAKSTIANIKSLKLK